MNDRHFNVGRGRRAEPWIPLAAVKSARHCGLALPVFTDHDCGLLPFAFHAQTSSVKYEAIYGFVRTESMNPIAKISPFFLILLLSSCGILSGPDPAESLADRIQFNVQEMREQGLKSKEFEFLPNPNKMKATSSDTNPTALLELVYYTDKGGSVLCFNKWYSTTYQNRFVWIPRSMSVSKSSGEAFVIKLTKVKDAVHLSEIR